MIRRLAENGLLYARLMGRDLIALPQNAGQAETMGDLLGQAMADMQNAVVEGDKDAQARRKGRAKPVEVLQALLG